MKRLIIIGITLFFMGTTIGVAQEDYRESLSGIKKVEVETNTTVYVKVGSANEIVFSKGAKCDGCEDDNDNYNYDNSNFNNNDDEEDKSRGLKAIYAGGVDNTGFGLEVERDGDVMRIKDLKSFTQRSGFTITVPNSVDLNLDGGSLGSVHVENYSGELEVRTSTGAVRLKDVTGPITAHTSVGAIDVKFSSVNQNAPISISSSTSSVDVSLPANTRADVELRSTMGNVYSNFDLEIPREDGLKPISGNRKIKGKLNGGGVKISLRSSTGNVYLRKN